MYTRELQLLAIWKLHTIKLFYPCSSFFPLHTAVRIRDGEWSLADLELPQAFYTRV